MENEIWKSIAGWEGFYEVSNLGRVKSVARVVPITGKGTRHIRERIRIPNIRYAPDGRPETTQVFLCRGNQDIPAKVHHLVLEAFVGPCPDGLMGCHNDGNPLNNRIDNLRWDTAKSNAEDMIGHGVALIGTRNGAAKMTEAAVSEARKMFAAGVRQSEISRKFGVSRATICRVVHGDSWAHVDVEAQTHESPISAEG